MGFIRKLKGNTEGVTLVEVLLAVAISAIIAAVVVAVHLAQERVYASEDAYMNMYRNTRTAMDRMTNSLRMAGYNPRDSSQFNPGIPYGGSDSIVMVIDYNGNGIPDGGDTVIYTSHKFASQGIDSLEFAYMDRSHDSLPTPVPTDSLSDIKSVIVTVIMKRDAGLPGPHRYELKREVKLRN